MVPSSSLSGTRTEYAEGPAHTRVSTSQGPLLLDDLLSVIRVRLELVAGLEKNSVPRKLTRPAEQTGSIRPSLKA